MGHNPLTTGTGRCIAVAALLLNAALYAHAEGPSMITSLDGEWLLATDADDAGRENDWPNGPVDAAVPAQVPWIIQGAFPGYHGLAWYWRSFEAPANPHPGGRYLLRFWQVDYKADVWVNGKSAGSHEGGESPFTLDVTDLVKPGANSVAVRVLNPKDEPIDGIVLGETPHRNKVCNYGAGSSFNHGGIVDSVELLTVPAVYLEDVFVRSDAATGLVRVTATVRNTNARDAQTALSVGIGPASEGRTLDAKDLSQSVPPGASTLEVELEIANPHRWDLNDPYLYRVSTRVQDESAKGSFDEKSVRTAFRDFRFENGYFRLNGRRIFLRSSHTGNHCPIGQQLPHDPDILRRDLLNVKVMGFNAIRFIAGVGVRYQLDLCDEIGLLVYEEPYSAWCLADSPHMADRFDESMHGMIMRDRNHPCIVIWGLLNETNDGPVFQHAADALPMVHALDTTRMVILNSGRWDGKDSSPMQGLALWHGDADIDPNVTYNTTKHAIAGDGITWAPGELALHPGAKGEASVVRWTAPVQAECRVEATFAGIAQKATTDVHVRVNGEDVFTDGINIDGKGNEATYTGSVVVKEGDTVEFVVGYGNGSYGGDSTALRASVATGGDTHDPAAAFSHQANPNGPWSYGNLGPLGSDTASVFTPYPTGIVRGATDLIGSLCNAGSQTWEHVLHDQHCYPRVPHTADVIRSLREYQGGGHPAGMGEGGYPAPPEDAGPRIPVFISEYGIGSAVDLVRVTRLFEQFGAANLEDAAFYRTQLDGFMNDWNRWGLAATFGRLEDYFAACVEKMADQRALGFNAIRANPDIVAFSLTGTVDQGMTGEGLTTTFREFKPGTFDAVSDGFAPLRWCLFAEPPQVYRGASVRLEAVLANEDALSPGEYPARIQVFGPDAQECFSRTVTVTIPEPGDTEPPLALRALDDMWTADVPTGRYRLVATFDHGAAAAGTDAEFFVTDPADMPAVDSAVTVWGDDADLLTWLRDHDIATKPFDTADAATPILVGTSAPADNTDAAFDALFRRVEAGATVVFLVPGVLSKGDDSTGRLPLADRGAFKNIYGWLYLKDEWCTRHPIFDGLPSGGLMDYGYYRDLIPNLVWSCESVPTEIAAGACKTSQGYDSGLLTAVTTRGSGRVVVNTLRIRDNLGTNPVAERLLRNMIHYGGTK